jgi:hypothetical protein
VEVISRSENVKFEYDNPCLAGEAMLIVPFFVSPPSIPNVRKVIEGGDTYPNG